MADQPLDLRMVTVGSLQENCYVVIDHDANQSVVVDPGAEPERILPLLGDTRVVAILLTHAHADHIGAVAAVRAATGAPVAIHPAELPALAPIHADTQIGDGDRIAIGTYLIRAVHTPGHTFGMLSFVVNDQFAIVGDTIFAGGPGHTWSADAFHTTLATLRDVVLRWPDDVVCYPGHGAAFRLGDQRAAITQFVLRDHPADFYGDAEW